MYYYYLYMFRYPLYVSVIYFNNIPWNHGTLTVFLLYYVRLLFFWRQFDTFIYRSKFIDIIAYYFIVNAFFICIWPTRFCVCRKQYCKIYLLLSEFSPICRSNASHNNVALEGEYLKYSCERVFQGNLPPQLKWFDQTSGEVIHAKNESSEGRTKFSFVVKIKPSHHGHSFTCQTYFDHPTPPAQHAINIPINLNGNAYEEYYTFAQLYVYCKY